MTMLAGFSTCVSSSYGAGEDYVYSIAITTAPVTYTFALGGAATWKVASVHSACPPAGGNCVGGIVTGSGTSASGNVTFPTNGTYYIIIDTWPTPTCGAFTLDITVPAPPPANDNCAGAITLTHGMTCVTTPGTVAGATESQLACSGTANDDVWYQFVATATSANVVVAGSTSFDAVVQVLSGTCGSSTAIACQDVTFGGGTETVALTGLTIGNTYYVRTHDWFATVPATLTFTICVTTPPPPPANDNCGAATSLTVNADLNCGVTTNGTTVSATQSTETAPSCSATGVNDDVWYSFTATGAAHQVRITGATNTTAVAVYSGSCGALTQLTGRGASTSSGSVSLNLTGLTASTTYRVRAI